MVRVRRAADDPQLAPDHRRGGNNAVALSVTCHDRGTHRRQQAGPLQRPTSPRSPATTRPRSSSSGTGGELGGPLTVLLLAARSLLRSLGLRWRLLHGRGRHGLRTLLAGHVGLLPGGRHSPAHPTEGSPPVSWAASSSAVGVLTPTCWRPFRRGPVVRALVDPRRPGKPFPPGTRTVFPGQRRKEGR
jgi:hypothetical protein